MKSLKPLQEYTHKQNFKRRKESRKNYSKNNANKKGGDKMEENMIMNRNKSWGFMCRTKII